jgi:hypothetical protein
LVYGADSTSASDRTFTVRFTYLAGVSFISAINEKIRHPAPDGISEEMTASTEIR